MYLHIRPIIYNAQGEQVVVAFDGEVAHMRAPIDIRVLDKPLYLLQATGEAGTAGAPQAAA